MRTLIAIPCFEKTDVAFEESLRALRTSPEDGIERAVSSLIYDARNELVKKAYQLGAEYMLWLDSDIVFEPDLLERLFDSLGDDDFVSGLYFRRKPPYHPQIYKNCFYDLREDGVFPTSDTYLDYPKDSRFEIASCGFGCVLMRTSMAVDILKRKGLPFSPLIGFGEDMSFCYKASECGYKLYCDSSIKVGHLAQTIVDENHYEAYKMASTTEE